MNVYYKEKGKLALIKVAGEEDHKEAILLVKEQLVADGDGYNEPVLALIHGGKQ